MKRRGPNAPRAGLVIALAWICLACRSPDTAKAVVQVSSSPAPGVSANEAQHEAPVQGSNKPTTEDEIISRLERLASGLPNGAKLQRIAIADVAYPRTQAENIAMGGYAILLITSVVHTLDELPLARASVRNAAGELPLQRAALRRSELIDPGLGAVLGRYRTDELYYLPVFLTRVPSQLVVDFARNRTGLEVLSFPPPASADTFPASISVIDDIAIPDVGAATILAREEFGWSLE